MTGDARRVLLQARNQRHVVGELRDTLALQRLTRQRNNRAWDFLKTFFTLAGRYDHFLQHQRVIRVLGPHLRFVRSGIYPRHERRGRQ